MKHATLFLLALLIYPLLPAQIIFDYQYPSGGTAKANYLRATPLGYLLGGEEGISIDVNGLELLRLPAQHARATFVAKDSGFVVAQNVIHVGRTKVKAHVLRYDKTGNQQWDRLFSSGIWRNFAEDVAVFEDGTMMYAGHHQSVTGSGAVIRKLDSAGNAVWEKKWNAGTTVASFAKELFPVDTSVCVLGNANAGPDGTRAARDMFVTSHGLTDGRERWRYLYQKDSTQDATDLLVIDQDNVLLVGNSNEANMLAGPRGVLVSITAGVENWTRTYPSIISEEFHAIEMAPDSGYILLGTRGIEGIDSVKSFLLRIDSDGDPMWEYSLPSAALTHKGIDMEREASMIYVVGGYSTDTTGGGPYFLTKIDISLLENPSTAAEALLPPSDFALTLFPNPTSDLLRIDVHAPLTANNTLRIHDLSGRLIAQSIFQSPSVYYDCTSLEGGIYLVEVILGKKRAVRRFVVAK